MKVKKESRKLYQPYHMAHMQGLPASSRAKRWGCSVVTLCTLNLTLMLQSMLLRYSQELGMHTGGALENAEQAAQGQPSAAETFLWA